MIASDPNRISLNVAQRAAVDSKSPLRLVIAGPGSGKTRTMVEAVKSAMKSTPCARIAVMTFTNAGAAEFRKRLESNNDTDHLELRKLVHCGTLHSYCFKLIQRFGGHLGYIQGKVALLPEAERIPRLLACRDKLGIKISRRTLEQYAGAMAAPVSRSAGCLGEGVALVWREYEFLLKRNNLVDWNGSLRVALAILWERVVPTLDYLFVDEVQDSAKIDFLLYNAIPATNKMFVGDVDQSIFGFRGAYPEELVRVASHEATDLHKLELNYRSDRRICEAANRLIAHNNKRVPKQITPTTAVVGHVFAEGFEDVGQELAGIHSLMIQCLNAYEANDIAVLFRTNHDAKVCRDYLSAMGIPITAQKFEQRPPDWERALLLLGLVHAGANDILAERYLLLDSPKAVVEQWKLKDQATGNSLSRRVAKGWVSGPPGAMSRGDIWRGDLQLLAQNGVSESTIRLIQGRRELLGTDATISDLLHDLHSNEETKVASDEATGVYVGTGHSAKGLEFDVVFAPGCEAEHYPGRDEIEESRRLLFVICSRAKHELYISWCQWRQLRWGGVQERKRSPFLAEMGL